MARTAVPGSVIVNGFSLEAFACDLGRSSIKSDCQSHVIVVAGDIADREPDDDRVAVFQVSFWDADDKTFLCRRDCDIVGCSR